MPSLELIRILGGRFARNADRLRDRHIKVYGILRQNRAVKILEHDQVLFRKVHRLYIQVLFHLYIRGITPPYKNITVASRVFRRRCRFHIFNNLLVVKRRQAIVIKEPHLVQIDRIFCLYRQISHNFFKIPIPFTREGITFDFRHFFKCRCRCSLSRFYRFLLDRYTVHVYEGHHIGRIFRSEFRHNRQVLAIGENRKVAVCSRLKTPGIILRIFISTVQETGKFGHLHGILQFRSVVMIIRIFAFATVPNNIEDAVARAPILRVGFIPQHSERFVGIFGGIAIMIIRPNIESLVQQCVPEQVPHLLHIRSITIACRHQDIADIEGVVQISSRLVCASGTNKTTDIKGIGSVLSGHDNITLHSHIRHFNNFVADTADAADIRFLHTQRYRRRRLFRLIGNQVLVRCNHLFENKRLAPLGLGEPTEDAPNEYAVQAIFYRNRAVIIQVHQGCRE